MTSPSREAPQSEFAKIAGKVTRDPIAFVKERTGKLRALQAKKKESEAERITREAEERQEKRLAEIEAKAETKAAQQREKAEFQSQQAAFRTGVAPGVGRAPRRRKTVLSQDPEQDSLAATGTVRRKTLLGR